MCTLAMMDSRIHGSLPLLHRTTCYVSYCKNLFSMSDFIWNPNAFCIMQRLAKLRYVDFSGDR